MKFNDFLNENYERQKGIEKLADLIIEKQAKEISRYYDRNGNIADPLFIDDDGVVTYRSVVIFNNTIIVKIGGDEIDVRDYGDIAVFIKNFQQAPGKTNKLIVLFDWMVGSTAGSYNTATGHITIFLDADYYKDLEEICEKVDGAPRHSLLKGQLSYKRSVLIHELTHAFDDFMSKGKTFANYSKFSKEDGKKSLIAYLKNPSEINARFQQTVSKMNFDPTRSGRRNPEDLIQNFKRNFKGWDIIEPDEQKRLIKRLFQFIDTKTPKKDLSSQTQILSSRLKRDYPELELNLWYRDDGGIDIDDFYIPEEYMNNKIGSIAMKRILNFADKYQRDVIVLSPQHGFKGTNIKKAMKFLDRFGFNRNVGREKDFRYKPDQYVRKPK